MAELAPERIKAFLDEVMLICLKHRIQIRHEADWEREWFELRDLDQEAGGLLVSDSEELKGFTANEELRWDEKTDRAIRSIDLSTVTAHQRIALARSLATGGFTSIPDRLPLVGEAVNGDFGWWR